MSQELKVYPNCNAMLADVATKGTKLPYRVTIEEEAGPVTLYVFAPTNQAAIVAAIRSRMQVHCRPVSADECMGALVGQQNKEVTDGNA